MTRNLLFSIASFVLGVSVTVAQQPQTVIRIKLLNGLNGNPLKLTKVGLEVSPGYRKIAVQTDQNGVAAISISKDSTILLTTQSSTSPAPMSQADWFTMTSK
jgi:hypothetical protein